MQALTYHLLLLHDSEYLAKARMPSDQPSLTRASKSTWLAVAARFCLILHLLQRPVRPNPILSALPSPLFSDTCIPVHRTSSIRTMAYHVVTVDRPLLSSCPWGCEPFGTRGRRWAVEVNAQMACLELLHELGRRSGDHIPILSCV
jgi:hypothetical protein